MRVLQLIDSLHPGGAERVSVNIANALAKYIEESFLCATRAEGILISSLDKDVFFIFLKKKYTIDFKAIYRLNKFVQDQKINILHAHSTSFFLAFIIKTLNPSIKLIWHDHYGNSEFLYKRGSWILKYCSKYFDYIFCVNKNLEDWARNYLKNENATYLPNFVVQNKMEPQTTLFGEDGKRIICLANLRPQKDHLTLIRAFNNVINNHPDWTLHLVGKDFNDDYSFQVKNELESNNLQKKVFLYGSRPDIYNILSQCEIGLLSSKSEGLPLTLLEYGLAQIPVLATKVGECESVIENKDYGILINPEDEKALCSAIIFLIKNVNYREKSALAFKDKIINKYSEKVVIETIIDVYKRI
jgi:glycosyltransferase involved in cell wall biosynthesis